MVGGDGGGGGGGIATDGIKHQSENQTENVTVVFFLFCFTFKTELLDFKRKERRVLLPATVLCCSGCWCDS